MRMSSSSSNALLIIFKWSFHLSMLALLRESGCYLAKFITRVNFLYVFCSYSFLIEL